MTVKNAMFAATDINEQFEKPMTFGQFANSIRMDIESF